jgi:helicase MOV-10
MRAAKLYAVGVPQGHFNYIFVDEAGHAEEPLTLAATAGLLASGQAGRLVLAGDPQQLGPIILSPVASRHGL